MSAFAAQQSIAFRANVSAKTVSSKRQSKKIVRSLRVEAAKKSVGDLSKGDLEGMCILFFKRIGRKKMRSNLRFFSSMRVRARCLHFRAQICLL